eukprot:1534314-Rhodomonas_salina.1
MAAGFYWNWAVNGSGSFVLARSFTLREQANSPEWDLASGFMMGIDAQTLCAKAVAIISKVLCRLCGFSTSIWHTPLTIHAVAAVPERIQQNQPFILTICISQAGSLPVICSAGKVVGHSRANLTEVALPAKASIEMKSRNLVRCKDCLLDFEDGILEEVEMKLMLLCVELLV